MFSSTRGGMLIMVQTNLFDFSNFICTEAVVRRSSVKKVPENFFNKATGQSVWQKCFRVSFAKFLRAPFI